MQRHGRVFDVIAHLEAHQSEGNTVGYLGVESHALVERPMSFGQILIAAPVRAWTITAQNDFRDRGRHNDRARALVSSPACSVWPISPAKQRLAAPSSYSP